MVSKKKNITPCTWGKILKNWRAYFSNGWFNHQLAKKKPPSCLASWGGRSNSWVFPKIGGVYPQNGWWKYWETLWTNGWFGGKTHYFRKPPHMDEFNVFWTLFLVPGRPQNLQVRPPRRYSFALLSITVAFPQSVQVRLSNEKRAPSCLGYLTGLTHYLVIWGFIFIWKKDP